MGIAAIYRRLTGKAEKHVPPYKNETVPITKSASDMGFKIQLEMKFYLASLGFRVVPHGQIFNGEMCMVEFDKDFAHVHMMETGEHRMVAYKELFNG